MATSRSLILLNPVRSSNLAAIGYDPEVLVLAVQFASGHIYHYANVPQDRWEALHAAPSKGQYYGREIKGRYGAEKITGTCVCGDIGYLGETCEDCGTGQYAA